MITVVIPAFNEEDYISACLESLSNQVTDEPYEVILVDNGSTDNTVTIAQRFLSRMNLRILHETEKGRGRARKKGWAAARGSIILSTDADTHVPHDWIESYAELFRCHPDAIAFTGWSRIDDIGRMRGFIQNSVQEFFLSVQRMANGYHCLPGHNFGMRRAAYEACGGFDETFDAWDDQEFTHRAATRGPIRFDRRLRVNTSGRRFRKGLIKGALDYPKTYVQKFWLKKEWVPLDDVR